MRKMFVTLLLIAAVALSCQAALAWDFPVTTDGFPYTPETLNVDAPPIPDYTAEVANGQLKLDIWWDIRNYGTISAAYVDADGVEYKMVYDKQEDRFYMEEPPADFAPEAPSGSYQFHWTFGTKEDSYKRDNYYVWVDAATGAYQKAELAAKDEKGYYTFEFNADGKVTSYYFSGNNGSVQGNWTIDYTGETPYMASRDYSLTFGDGVIVDFNHLGEAQSIYFFDAEGTRFYWNGIGWTSNSEYSEAVAPYKAENYPAPYAEEKDSRIFASLADIGIDFDAIIAGLPDLDALNYTAEDGKITVMIGEMGFENLYPAFVGGGSVSIGMSGTGSGKRISFNLEGNKKEDIYVQTYVYASPAGYRVKVEFDEQGSMRSVTVDSKYSPAFPFDTVKADYENNGQITFSHDGQQAFYTADGALTSYSYPAREGLEIFFDARGTLTGYDDIDGNSYNMDELRVQYGPLEIIGEVRTSSAAEPLDSRIYATLDASGHSASEIEAMIPQLTGVSIDDNHIVTLEDHGYRTAYCYPNYERRFDGVLADGIWTIDLSEYDWDSNEKVPDISTRLVDDQGNAVTSLWQYPDALMNANIIFADAERENGIIINAYVARYILSSPGERFVINYVFEDNRNTVAYYNEDGTLVSYYYTAADGTKATFLADGTLVDTQNANGPVTGTYAPLQVIE